MAKSVQLSHETSPPPLLGDAFHINIIKQGYCSAVEAPDNVKVIIKDLIRL